MKEKSMQKLFKDIVNGKNIYLMIWKYLKMICCHYTKRQHPWLHLWFYTWLKTLVIYTLMIKWICSQFKFVVFIWHLVATMTIIVYAIPYHFHVTIITWVNDHDFKRSCDHLPMLSNFYIKLNNSHERCIQWFIKYKLQFLN
jgi:hypothetical protein